MAKNISAEEGDFCFGESEGDEDHMGLVSFGIFIVIVGIVFVTNQNLVSDLTLWIERMTSEQSLIRPPEGLIGSAVIFFSLIGFSDFLKAGIRLRIGQPRKRVLADILSGITLVLFAYLIHLYGSYVLTWQMTLAIEIVSCGLLIILYSIIRYEFLSQRTIHKKKGS